MDQWRTWTNEELERQVSPSRWNPRKSGNDVINQYIAICSSETQRARERISHRLDISYGSSLLQKYDLYGTDLPENSPIFFWIHGGYWQEGSKDISATMVQNLYVIGIKTVVFGYTLAPEVTLFQILEEFYMALRHVMQSCIEAPLVVGGHSAGAHIAAQLLHNQKDADFEELQLSKRLKGLALFSGVYDLRPIVPTYVNDAVKLTASDAVTLSPLLQTFESMKFEDIRFVVCVGEHESDEFKRQTTNYASRLQERFAKVEKWVSMEDDHFTLIERFAESPESSDSPAFILINFVKSAFQCSG